MNRLKNAFSPLLLGLIGLWLFSTTQAAAQVIETPGEFVSLMDAESGEILFQKNADATMAPASMSKLMTVAMLFEALKHGVYTLDDTFPVSKNAWKKQGSKMWVLVDEEIRIEDLLRGIIVQSGNDACIVVAEGMAGSEEAFADQMTEFGKKIGLKNSTFRNSTGWPDPEHRVSANDLATLARHIITEYPDYYPYFAEKEFTWSDIKQPNRNPLLFRNVGADGLKTGHTEESGYGLVASSVRDGRRLVLVINGLISTKQRDDESRRLLNVGHREFKAYPLYEGGEQVVEAEVWNGKKSRIPLVVTDPVKVHLHRLARNDLEVKVNYTDPLPAPVTAGTQVGVITINAPGLQELKVPVVAGEDVLLTGVFGRVLTALEIMLFGSQTEQEG